MANNEDKSATRTSVKWLRQIPALFDNFPSVGVDAADLAELGVTVGTKDEDEEGDDE
jgi:hypothetical protein